MKDETLANEAINLAGSAVNNYDKLCIIYAGQLGTKGNSLNPQANAIGGTWYITSEKVNNAFSHIGIHCHEFGHLLGLTDHYNGAAPNTSSYGRWGLMGTGYKNGPNYGSQPAHIAGASKVNLGFVPVINLTESSFGQTIYPTSNNNYNILFCREITFWIENPPLSPVLIEEKIIIENRQKTANTFDHSVILIPLSSPSNKNNKKYYKQYQGKCYIRDLKNS
ncbi:MAG TPA: hypothetical protein ENN22_14720 [bacterium]|nr:hypothetical protein [bacterium]